MPNQSSVSWLLDGSLLACKTSVCSVKIFIKLELVKVRLHSSKSSILNSYIEDTAFYTSPDASGADLPTLHKDQMTKSLTLCVLPHVIGTIFSKWGGIVQFYHLIKPITI